MKSALADLYKLFLFLLLLHTYRSILIKKSISLNKINNVSLQSCPDGQTCCPSGQGRQACCPIPDGSCCPDYQSCCMNLYPNCVCAGTCPGPTCSCSGCSTTCDKKNITECRLPQC